jgi:hypothetical protein
MVGRIATCEIEEGAGAPPDDGKDPAAVELGHKGGKARAEGITAKRRKEIAKRPLKFDGATALLTVVPFSCII